MQKRCAQCGKEFRVKPSHYEKKTYCSKACMATAYKTRLLGPNNPHFTNASKRICQTCSKEYQSYSKTRKYCSSICAGKSAANIAKLREICYLPKPRRDWICGRCGNTVDRDKRNKFCPECWKLIMGTQGRIDANQHEIVEGLRQLGASVISLANVKHGCPDIMVGFRGNTYLMEIKSKTGKLTPAQEKWHAEWRGQKAVVRSLDEAVNVLIGQYKVKEDR